MPSSVPARIPIPFHRIALSGREKQYLTDVCDQGKFSAGGPFSKRCQEFLASQFGLPHSLLTSSATGALEASLLLLNLRSGDEVILPSFIFPSAGNAILRAGGVPVFADILEDTLTLDVESVESLLSKKTRAVIVMHYGGVAAELSRLRELVDHHCLFLIEDAAQSLGAKYHGKSLGTFGDVSAFSFHETKNITSGEGGAIVINKEGWRARAEILRDKGTDRARFLRGEVDRYSWVDIGGNFGMSELQAAFLLAQLEAASDFQRKRQEIFERYLSELSDLESVMKLPVIPAECESNYHTFHLILPDAESVRQLMGDLAEEGIAAHSHYEPLHHSAMGQSRGVTKRPLPVTDSLPSRLIRLPIYPDLSELEQSCIISHIHRIFSCREFRHLKRGKHEQSATL